jgi:hypothetical protein
VALAETLREWRVLNWSGVKEKVEQISETWEVEEEWRRVVDMLWVRGLEVAGRYSAASVRDGLHFTIR